MKRLTAILAVLVLLCVLTVSVSAATTVAEGKDGDLTWVLDSDGKLTITGTGAITDSDIVYIEGAYRTDKSWGQYYSQIKTLEIGDGVTGIGSYAFYGCSGLTSVTIGSGVTSIGDGAFYECSYLMSVTIGSGVTSIGSYAFSGCSGLTSVTIPDSVTSIGGGAFDETPWLKSLGDFAVVNGILLRYQGKSKNVTIPNSVVSIGEDAFRYCYSLTSVTIPNSVTSIGDGAFFLCGLTSVTIPNSVTSIGDNAFYACSSLTDVYYDGYEKDLRAMYDFPDDVTIHAKTLDAVGSFTSQLYTVCLGRGCSAEEIAYYRWMLTDQGMTGVEAAYNFVFSDEFKMNSYCDRHYTIALYEAFMGREPTEEEISHWIWMIQQGSTREDVFNFFATSTEFDAVCTEAGITQGGALNLEGQSTHASGYCTVEGCHQTQGLADFSVRLYETCLGRTPVEDEINAWHYNLNSGLFTAKTAAYAFLFSDEFINYGYDNETFVTCLYEAMMGRDPAQDELAYWCWMLADQGLTREGAFNQFVDSDEFKVICADFNVVCK